MKLAIMQPYFFPYIGYFQLINAVDTFIIYDDVNYIKNGWINRNNILLAGGKHLFTIALKGASSFRLIKDISVGSNRGKVLKTIFQSYCKAPFFEDAYPIVEASINFGDNNLAIYIFNSITRITEYLDIKTNIVMSSSIEKDDSLKGAEKVIHICKLMNANAYINAVGGQHLYSKADFKTNNVDLFFIKTNDVTYKQFDNEFINNLSIIDVLMFNSKEIVKNLLNQYELI
jgi:hypothetical protein